MAFWFSCAVLTSVALCTGVSAAPNADPATKACQLLASTFPKLVAFPGTMFSSQSRVSCRIANAGSEQYSSDIEHWVASSTQNATCSIEPETADDICKIVSATVGLPFAIPLADLCSQLKIIGRDDIRAPFAVSV